MNKTVLIVIVLVVVGLFAFSFINNSSNQKGMLNQKNDSVDNKDKDKNESSDDQDKMMDKDESLEDKDKMMEEDGTDKAVSEFQMDSFVEMVDGKPMPQFSLKEITVKKGDKVKININTTSGKHDFKLDEFDVFADTPTGQVTTVEFVADKAGEFIYYCNQPGHRTNGHWGTLIVTE